MLRTFSAFLLVFWFLGLVVHLGGLIHLFGMASVALFVMDLVLTSSEARDSVSRARGEPLL